MFCALHLGYINVTAGLVSIQEPGSTVLVAGATGGVGQLTTAKLLEVRLDSIETPINAVRSINAAH